MAIEGWLSDNEKRVLAELAKESSSFLEVGPWVGLSTSIIGANLRHRQFVTVELDPTEEHFRWDGALWEFRLNEEVLGLCTDQSFQTEMIEILRTGVVRNLKKNLTMASLEWIPVIVGDFAAIEPVGGPYTSAFFDVTHTAAEILRTFTAAHRWLAPGATIACHDITDALLPCCLRYCAIQRRVDSLAIGSFRGESNSSSFQS